MSKAQGERRAAVQDEARGDLAERRPEDALSLRQDREARRAGSHVDLVGSGGVRL